MTSSLQCVVHFCSNAFIAVLEHLFLTFCTFVFLAGSLRPRRDLRDGIQSINQDTIQFSFLWRFQIMTLSPSFSPAELQQCSLWVFQHLLQDHYGHLLHVCSPRSKFLIYSYFLSVLMDSAPFSSVLPPTVTLKYENMNFATARVDFDTLLCYSILFKV